MSGKRKKNDPNAIKKTIEELSYDFKIKLEDLEELTNKLINTFKIFDLTDIEAKRRIKNECGKIATILYILAIESGSGDKNVSILNLLGIKSKIRMYETPKRKIEKLTDLKTGEVMHIVVSNDLPNDQVALSTNLSDLTTILNGKIVPRGYKDLLKTSTPITQYMSRSIMTEISRLELITYFRTNFGSHSGGEGHKEIFQSKNYSLVTLILDPHKLGDVEFVLTLEATLVQIAIEFIHSIKNYQNQYAL